MKKFYFLKYGLLACFLLVSILGFSQTIKISGEIIDESSQPMPGISVSLKGNVSKSTATDKNGAFVLSGLQEGNYTISITSIGYQPFTKELSLKADYKLDVKMQPLSTGLEQVVVVGYGSQRKTSITGAVTTVSGREILRSPTSNVTNSLIGRSPGLGAVQRSGQPGSNSAVINIRGLATYNGLPVSTFLSKQVLEDVVAKTMTGGATLTKLLGTSAWYGPGAAVAFLVDSILNNQKRLIPCSVYLEGEYGEHDICIGVPCIIGKDGIHQIVDVQLDEVEKEKFAKSAEAVRNMNKDLSSVL